MASNTEHDLQYELGRLIGVVGQLDKSLTAHRKEFMGSLKDASDKRAAMYDRIASVDTKIDHVDTKVTNVENQVVPLKKRLDEYEPDMKRCRMLRNYGIISVGLITATGAVIGWAVGIYDKVGWIADKVKMLIGR